MNPAQHISQAVKIQKRVYLVGTANATYYEGTGVCYNRDYGTAANADGNRDKRVEVPSTTNNYNFAGVLDKTITLDATGEGWVNINEPGSVCNVALGSDTVVNTTILNCICGGGGVGRFRSDIGVAIGRGSALALQTNTSGNVGEAKDSNTAAVATATITSTALFASAAAGDKVVILSGMTTAAEAGPTAGVYTISSVTDDDNAVLTASPGDGQISCYVISGNPTALCQLFDGEETGMVEWCHVDDSAAVGAMVGGMTHVSGGGATLAANTTDTLADGTRTGMKKGFFIEPTAAGTNDYVVTVTSGVQLDGATALATLTMDGSSDYSLLEWDNLNWKLIANSGTALASA